MVELLWIASMLVSAALAQTPGIQLTTVVTGLGAPTDIQHAADGSNRLFLVEQVGRVRIFQNGVLQSTPFLDIRNKTTGSGERGLLGLAFAPNFPSSKRFYVNYTNLSGNTVIAMYTVSTSTANTADPATEVVLMTVPQPFSNHNGGQIQFGPDGYLYIAMGDGGSSGDPFGNAQNRNSLLGKILRIDVESQPGAVRIPPSNPFVNTAGARAEIWATGLRNPWRFSFDRSTHDLWIADVGQGAWEEVNFQPASSAGGENYGWDTMEGNHCYAAATCNMTGLTPPVAEYGHSLGCSVTGGFVYRGTQFPALAGTYFYGDYCSGRIWSVRREGGQFVNQLALESGVSITTFGEDEAGELYLADSGGNIRRVELAAPTVSVTIASAPTGQRFVVDSGATQYTAPRTFTWTQGSVHSVQWINGTTATRLAFSGWTDGDTSNPRAITATAATYTGNFTTEHLVTQTQPVGGAITLTPSSNGYYATGTTVEVTASASFGYVFTGFSGCTASATTPASFVVNAPCTISANFAIDTSAVMPLRFVPVAPCRLMDTRESGMPLAATVPRDLAIPTGPCGIPASAKAYSLNVTAVPREPLSYLTVWPTGQTQPTVSTLNSFGGQVVANAAIVPAGANGAIRLFATGATDLVIDINGYFSSAASNGLLFHPITPCRPVDTREQPPILENGGSRSFALTAGPCALPAAAAYSLNATVVPEGTLQYLTLWPTGAAQPLVSTLNSFEGQVVANAAIVPSGTANQVSAYVAGRTHLILDANGYFSATAANGLQFYAVQPCRVLDTRNTGGALNAGTSRDIAIPQGDCGIPSTAQAYALNVTVVPQGPLSYLTLWPTGQPRPLVSTLNAFDGRVLANAALVPAGANGSVSVYVTGRTDVVLDINGYFAP